MILSSDGMTMAAHSQVMIGQVSAQLSSSLCNRTTRYSWRRQPEGIHVVPGKTYGTEPFRWTGSNKSDRNLVMIVIVHHCDIRECQNHPHCPD